MDSASGAFTLSTAAGSLDSQIGNPRTASRDEIWKSGGEAHTDAYSEITQQQVEIEEVISAEGDIDTRPHCGAKNTFVSCWRSRGIHIIARGVQMTDSSTEIDEEGFGIDADVDIENPSSSKVPDKQVDPKKSKKSLFKKSNLEWSGQTAASLFWIISVFIYGISSTGDILQLCAALSWLAANMAAFLPLE